MIVLLLSSLLLSLEEIANDIHPLVVPTRYLGSDFVPLERLYFAFKSAIYGAKRNEDGHKVPISKDGITLAAGCCTQFFLNFSVHKPHSCEIKIGHESCTGDIQVGEVGAVGLVAVIVKLAHPRARKQSMRSKDGVSRFPLRIQRDLSFVERGGARV